MLDLAVKMGRVVMKWAKSPWLEPPVSWDVPTGSQGGCWMEKCLLSQSPPLGFHLYHLYVYLYPAAVDSTFFAPFFSFGPQTLVAFCVIYRVQFLKWDVVDGTDNTAKLRRAAWAPVGIGCPFLTVHAITGCDHIPTCAKGWDLERPA